MSSTVSEKKITTKSSDCNEVLLESTVEWEGSYQTSHKKIDKEVDSQVNGLS